jgi:hypothetical protein
LHARPAIATMAAGAMGGDTMKKGWIAAALMIVAAGCVQHAPGWDDAWAACEAEAIKQMEFAEVDHDQRSEWRENYIRGCMDRKGFEEPSTI